MWSFLRSLKAKVAQPQRTDRANASARSGNHVQQFAHLVKKLAATPEDRPARLLETLNASATGKTARRKGRSF